MFYVFEQHDLLIGQDSSPLVVGGCLVYGETVDFVSQMFDKVKGGDSGACRNEKCYDHSGYGGVNAGVQQGVPDKCSDDDVEHLGYDVASVADG